MLMILRHKEYKETNENKKKKTKQKVNKETDVLNGRTWRCL